MVKVLGFFWYLCTFRAGPERVPTSSVFAFLVIGLYLVVSVGAALFEPVLKGSLLKALNVVLIVTAVQLGIFGLLLMFKGVIHRYKETFLALLGADSLLTLIGVSILGMITFLSGYLDEAGFAIQISRMALTVLVIWSLAVTGFILHRASNTGLFLGNAIALGSFIMAQIVIIEIFIPAPGN